LAVLSASLALAEDFKTIKGKVYKDATISRVDADGIVLRTKTGISKVYFIELPKDVQERFHPRPSPTKTVAAQREREPIKENGLGSGDGKSDCFYSIRRCRDYYYCRRGVCYRP
jgi:hypothetical protein